MTTSDRLSAMRGRLSASRARAGSSLAGKSLFNKGGDGDVVSAKPVVSGIELAHICDANQLCLGKVGETKMCLQVLSSGATRCGTASHANKATTGLTSFSFLAVKGNAKTAFCQPCLATDDLEPTLIESLLGRADVDWPGQFNLISCEEVTDLQKESDMSDRALTVKKVKNGYMTPLKRVKQGSVLQDTEDAWGDSYKELNGLEDVTIALQNVEVETDETKRTSLFNDFQAAVA